MGPRARRSGFFAAAQRRWEHRKNRGPRHDAIRGTIATANIGRKANALRTGAYMEAIRDEVPAGRDITVIVFQEIDGGDQANEHGLLRQVFAEGDGWHLEAMNTQTPIAWRGGARTWQLAARVVVDHAMAGIPRQSPGRSVVDVPLEETSDGDGLLVIVGTHFPIGYRDHRAPGVTALLLAGWAKVQAAVRRGVRLGRRYEADVLAAADTNRNDTPDWHPAEVLGTDAHVIDRISLVPARRRGVRVIRTGQVVNTAGERFHPCRWASFTFYPTTDPKEPR